MTEDSFMPYYAELKASLSRLWKSTYIRVFGGCVLTLLLMLAYDWLPERRYVVALGPHVQADIYADEKNAARWLDKSELRWRCLAKVRYPQAFCGFSREFTEQHPKGIDLSNYTHVNVELDYTGTASRLRFYLRNFEPDFSSPGDIQSAKFIQTNIPSEFVHGHLTLYMDEFYVAEWWASAYDLPRRLASPSFNHVVSFGIDLPYPVEEGNHDFQLKHLEFVGVWVTREQWYAGLLIFWIVLLAVFGAVKYVQLRRGMAREGRRLEALKARTVQLQNQSDEYRKRSEQDQLTGLLNCHGLSERISQEFGAGETRELSLLVADVDHFKSVNDRFGHDVGDQILKELGDLIAGHLRQTDHAARWGGEEFVVLLPDTRLLDAHTIAEKLRSLVAGYNFRTLPGEHLTVSLGVGGRKPKEAYHELFRRVDKALYRAKGLGRNRTVLADD